MDRNPKKKAGLGYVDPNFREEIGKQVCRNLSHFLSYTSLIEIDLSSVCNSRRNLTPSNPKMKK
jgi:cobyrinic acid a,c-diamide synthase